MSTWRPIRSDDEVVPRLAALPRGAGAALPMLVVEGEIALRRALAGGLRIDAVLATPTCGARIDDVLPPQCDRVVASEAEISAHLGWSFHRGCVAVGPRPDPAPAFAGLTERGRGIVVIGDRIADPINVGALLRNARAFDARVILVGCGDPFSRRAVRASMGWSLERPPWVAPDLDAAFAAVIRVLPMARIVAATTEADALPLHDLPAGAHDVLVLGNEGEGLDAPTRARAHVRVAIPMAAGVDSLNVAAAAAVFLYAMTRG